MTRMNPHVDAYLDPNAHESHSFDRRTLVVGTTGALVAAALGGSARAAHFASSAGPVARAQFDPALASGSSRCLTTWSQARRKVPGAILHSGAPAAAAGQARLGSVGSTRTSRCTRRSLPGRKHREAVRRHSRLAARRAGRFTLDTALPDVLPADVVDRFPTAPAITLRMLLAHRSGLADWSTPATDVAAARSARVWKVSESLDLAAAKKPLFAPGHATPTRTPNTRCSGWSSNTRPVAAGAGSDRPRHQAARARSDRASGRREPFVDGPMRTATSR